MGRIKLGKKRDRTGIKAKIAFIGEVQVSREAHEGGKIVMQRLAKGLSARPGGKKGETFAIARCTGCRVRALMRDIGGMVNVSYEPYETSHHCKYGLEGKAKGLYCREMKPAFEAAQYEFYESVYRDHVKGSEDGKSDIEN